nr:isoprenylcysteine carboxylmethyltransferase family protein [uncultured Carboxylicivirga sp.]
MAIYLFIYYCVFLITVFVIPSYLTYKKTGIKPFRFDKKETAINYVGKAYKMISALAFLTIIINAFIPQWMEYFVAIDYIQNDILQWIGFALLHLSFILIVIAQRNMASEWRIGIDNENEVKLVTRGLFSISRNPIFLAVILLFAALFLIIPNIITTLILITGTLVIQIQVRLEEEFLSDKLGEEYKLYKKMVKRWLL